MVETNIAIGEGALPLEQLPRSALQAIYHAVTGKTETYNKTLTGNVVIRSTDIDRLYIMLREQMTHYDQQCDPTVTIVVKCSNDKSIQYSSWERYSKLRVNNHDQTSDVTMKLEFVIQLPGTIQPQRCIVNVILDSSLPVIQEGRTGLPRIPELSPLSMFAGNWRTGHISIDFVDFLVAKIFSTVVEEWFGTLEKISQPKVNSSLFNNYGTLRTAVGQFGSLAE